VINWMVFIFIISLNISSILSSLVGSFGDSAESYSGVGSGSGIVVGISQYPSPEWIFPHLAQ